LVPVITTSPPPPVGPVVGTSAVIVGAGTTVSVAAWVVAVPSALVNTASALRIGAMPTMGPFRSRLEAPPAEPRGRHP
jgi:hypothetical protein